MNVQLDKIKNIQDLFDLNLKNSNELFILIKMVQQNIKKFEYLEEKKLIEKANQGINVKKDFIILNDRIRFLLKTTIGLEKNVFDFASPDFINAKEVFLRIYKMYETSYLNNSVSEIEYFEWLKDMAS
jgi:hypothetical protein